MSTFEKMKALEELLGDKYYYIGSEDNLNKINAKQFEKFKKICLNKDESEKSNAWFKGQ